MMWAETVAGYLCCAAYRPDGSGSGCRGSPGAQSLVPMACLPMPGLLSQTTAALYILGTLVWNIGCRTDPQFD